MWVYADHDLLQLTNDEKRRLEGHYHDTNIVPSNCQYCGSGIGRLGSKAEQQKRVELHACPVCGWWVVTKSHITSTYEAVSRQLYRRAGLLRQLNTSDMSIPVEELRRYLTAQYDDRFYIHPRKYEDLVGGVFSDFGYRIRVTSFSRDDGIDIIVFDGDAGDQMGVQVKRYRGKIEAEQIRSFAGALLLGGITTGIFVTTSKFTKGAMSTAKAYDKRGLAITLWDAKTFYDRLTIAAHPAYSTAEDPSAPFFALWDNPEQISEIHSVEL